MLLDVEVEPPMVEQEDASGVVVVSSFGVAREAPGFLYGTTIEGVEVRSSSFIDATHYYARFIVTCPCSKDLHKVKGKPPCSRSRTFVKKHMEHFGVAEVYAYLGLWMRQALDETTRQTHMDKPGPSVDEIRAYCIEHGWLGQEVRTH